MGGMLLLLLLLLLFLLLLQLLMSLRHVLSCRRYHIRDENEKWRATREKFENLEQSNILQPFKGGKFRCQLGEKFQSRKYHSKV